MKQVVVSMSIAVLSCTTVYASSNCDSHGADIIYFDTGNTSSTGGNGTSGNNTPENSTDPNIAIQQLLIKEQGSTYAHHIDKTIFS